MPPPSHAHRQRPVATFPHRTGDIPFSAQFGHLLCGPRGHCPRGPSHIRAVPTRRNLLAADEGGGNIVRQIDGHLFPPVPTSKFRWERWKAAENQAVPTVPTVPTFCGTYFRSRKKSHSGCAQAMLMRPIFCKFFLSGKSVGRPFQVGTWEHDAVHGMVAPQSLNMLAPESPHS